MRLLNNAAVVLALVVAGAAVLGALFVPDGRFGDVFGQKMTPAGSTQRAISGDYTECFAAKLWVADGADVNAGKVPQTVRVPSGWRVVGGTSSFQAIAMGGVPAPAMIICRDVSLAPRVLPKADALGRCSAAEVSEMMSSGMSSSAITSACSP